MKTTYSLVLAIGFMMLTLILPPASEANFVVNGDFENGTSSWTPIGNDSAGGLYTVGSNHFFVLNAAGSASSDPTIRQTISGLESGKTYSVTWDQYYYHHSYGTIGFGVFIDNQPGNPYPPQRLRGSRLGNLLRHLCRER